MHVCAAHAELTESLGIILDAQAYKGLIGLIIIDIDTVERRCASAFYD